MDAQKIIDALQKNGIKAERYSDEFFDGVICDTLDAQKIQGILGNRYKLINSASQVLIVIEDE